jgi:hypothetical protein
MTGDAAVEAIAPRAAAARPFIRDAARVVVVAAAIGVAGQLLFFDVGLGVNFPIAIALLLLGAWRLRSGQPISRLDAWLAPAALTFAAFAAVRADATLVALDVLTSITLAGAAVASFGGRAVVPKPIDAVIGLALLTIGWILGGAAHAVGATLRAMPPRSTLGRRTSNAMPVLRGLLIAIPIVLLFVAFFSSADAVFARLIDDLFGFQLDLGDAVWRASLALVLAWLAAGALALAASSPPSETAERAATRWHLGTTEVFTVLVAVDLVFAVFVALQAAYLFGGLDTLAASGLTYSAYARRGFFELVIVAVMAGGLIVAADRLASPRTRRVVASAMVLAALTGVVLASAAVRLRLYQEAYGWTELRLYVVATMALLVVLVIGLLVSLALDRVRWIGHVAVVGALAIGLALNVIGPVRFITEQNVARVLEPSLVPAHGVSGLDEAYVAALGDDAIPGLVRALPALDDRSDAFLREQLRFRLEELRLQPGLNAWQAWNAGRSAARDALERAESRGELR